MNSKPPLKVLFSDFWPGFPEDDCVWKDFLQKRYDVVQTAENPDVVIFGPFGMNHLRFPKDKYLKLFVSPENFMEHQYDAFYKHTGWFAVKQHCHYSITSFEGDPETNLRFPCFINRWGFDSLHKIEDVTPVEKTKGIVYMAQNSVGWRDHLVKDLQELVPIDCAGSCLKNIETTVPPGAPAKLEFIKDYKFVIGFENSLTPGYVTEKLVEPWMVNAIPIYVGDPDAAQDFNEDTFINATHMKTTQDIFDRIKEIHHDDSLYESMISKRKVLNTSFFSEERLAAFFRKVVGR